MIKYTLLFLLFIISSPKLFSQKTMEKVIEIPWNTEDGCKLENLDFGTVGISSYQIISNNEIAILCDYEGIMKVYNIDNQNLSYQFTKDPYITWNRFLFSRNLEKFYIFDNYSKINCYTKEGLFINSFDISKKIVFEGILLLKEINNNLYAICNHMRNTYTLVENGIPLSSGEQETKKIDGVYDSKGNVIKISKISKTEFIITTSNNQSKTNLISLESDYLENEIYCIGSVDDMILLSLSSFITFNPMKIRRQIVFFSKELNEIIKRVDVPIPKEGVDNEIQLYDNAIYQMTSTPNNAILLKHEFSNDKSYNFQYPAEYMK